MLLMFVVKLLLMVVDVFINLDYMCYVVKMLFVCLICYIFYSGVDWEGIYICMLICVIVVNLNVGLLYQKMVLCFGGVFCGVILVLLFMLLVMFWLDNIVELLFVLVLIFLLGVWIVISFECFFYIGIQMVVIFVFVMFENVFGLVYDLVEICDCVLGIIIGIVVFVVIYIFVWFESEVCILL